MHKATERGCHALIIDTVKDTWICNLRHDKIIYSDVTTKAPMDHPQLCCYGIHELNVVDLISEMLTYYCDEACVPGYINILENAQKKVQSSQLPITNAPSWSSQRNQYFNTKYLPPR